MSYRTAMAERDAALAENQTLKARLAELDHMTPEELREAVSNRRELKDAIELLRRLVEAVGGTDRTPRPDLSAAYREARAWLEGR